MTAVFVGLMTVDLIQRVPRLPGPDEKLTALDAELLAGGPAAVAALTASVLGSPSTLVTALGSHPLAETAAAELRHHSVRVVDATPGSDALPPVSAVAVREDTGERSVVSRNAAGRAVEPPASLSSLVAGAEVLLLDGHHPHLALAAAQEAARNQVPVLLDAGSWKPVLAELVPLVDLAVCSADFRVPGTERPDQQGAALRADGVGAVAVTRGADSVLCWAADGTRFEVPARAVDAVDTLGAGDVFHGAVAHAMRRTGGSGRLHDVIDFACEVAATRAAHRGRQGWIEAIHSLDEQCFSE